MSDVEKYDQLYRTFVASDRLYISVSWTFGLEMVYLDMHSAYVLANVRDNPLSGSQYHLALAYMIHGFDLFFKF